jgi:hypothetical protein
MQTMVNYSAEIEFFFVSSYPMLLTVFARLEDIRKQDKKAVLFCFSTPLYSFLSPLSAEHPWITVHYVDIGSIAGAKVRYPWVLWRTRRELRRLYQDWFVKIPDKSIVHFFSRFDLLAGYWIWRLRQRCSVYYAECGPVDLYQPANGPAVWAKWLALYAIYPIPFQMLRLEGAGLVNAFPALTDQFLQDAVDVQYSQVTDVAQIRLISFYHTLTTRCHARLLWVTQPFLDSGFVLHGEYLDILAKCVHIVNQLCPPEWQAIKFHPRTQRRESVWDSTTEILPQHIPAEFLELPDLRIVLTVTSTAASVLGSALNVKIISLVELIPFSNDAIREYARRATEFFAAGLECYCPASLTELQVYLNDFLEVLGL